MTQEENGEPEEQTPIVMIADLIVCSQCGTRVKPGGRHFCYHHDVNRRKTYDVPESIVQVGPREGEQFWLIPHELQTTDPLMDLRVGDPRPLPL